jgi:hypothetical protein
MQEPSSTPIRVFGPYAIVMKLLALRELKQPLRKILAGCAPERRAAFRADQSDLAVFPILRHDHDRTVGHTHSVDVEHERIVGVRHGRSSSLRRYRARLRSLRPVCTQPRNDQWQTGCTAALVPGRRSPETGGLTHRAIRIYVVERDRRCLPRAYLGRVSTSVRPSTLS